MPKKQKINILWYTKDLRTRDQESLYQIMQEDTPLLALYIFDEDFYREKQWGFRKCGRYRAKFLLETVRGLSSALKEKNIPFLVKYGKTESIFKELSEKYTVEKIFCQQEWTRDENETERRIKNVLPFTSWEKSYTQFLISPDCTREYFAKVPIQFTAFRQKLEKNFTVREEFDSEHLTYNKSGPELHFTSDDVSLKSLGFDEFEPDRRTAFPFSGGERRALERLSYYFSGSGKLDTYKETRNGMKGTDYSSRFSAWLADGSLSAVTVYHEIKKYEARHGSNESSYWMVFELLWRDFFRHTSLEYGDRIFHQHGINRKVYDYTPDPELIRQWTEGETASGFINANMLELKHTGWMSNRGRQNVASYFSKILKQDWRIGAAYFEEMLIDYDVHSNYGNWMYLAGVGNDPRNRIFSPEKQAAQYDPEQEFIQLWLNR